MDYNLQADREVRHTARSSTNLMMQFLSVICALAALAALLPAFVLLEPSLRVTKLAEWTAKKDFWEYCWNQQAINATLEPLCTAVLNMTLYAPPLPQRTLGVALHRAGGYMHILDKDSDAHEVILAPWVLSSLMCLGILLLFIPPLCYGLYTYRKRKRARHEELELQNILPLAREPLRTSGGPPLDSTNVSNGIQEPTPQEVLRLATAVTQTLIHHAIIESGNRVAQSRFGHFVADSVESVRNWDPFKRKRR